MGGGSSESEKGDDCKGKREKRGENEGKQGGGGVESDSVWSVCYRKKKKDSEREKKRVWVRMI